MIKVISAKRFPKKPRKEISQILFENERTRIETIISPRGFSNQKGFWYDQNEDEFVRVIRGEAELLFEGNQFVKMIEGDSIYIPAHSKHRVERTRYETEWLAVFYKK